MRTGLLLCGIIGSILCAYDIYITIKVEENGDFEPLCDLGFEAVQCSKVIKSDYSYLLSKWNLVSKDSMLNLSNAILFMPYYLFIIGYNFQTSIPKNVLFYASAAVCLGCVYLACVLMFVIKTLCLVCAMLYVVSGTIFYYGLEEYKEYERI